MMYFVFFIYSTYFFGCVKRGSKMEEEEGVEMVMYIESLYLTFIRRVM